MKRKTVCEMEYRKDSEGKEVLLKDGQFQVMMEWEKPYMEACIERLAPSGDVLEVGFGCGYSAEAIQKFSPTSHTIIEFHPEVAKKAREWAKSHPGVKIVEGTWQEMLSTLGQFDALFFDDYPLETAEETRTLESSEKEGQSFLRENAQVLKEVEAEIAPFQLEAGYRFSQGDLDEFVDQLAAFEVAEEIYLLRFIKEFEGEGRLEPQMVTYLLNQCQEKGLLSQEGAEGYDEIEMKPKPVSHDRFYRFFWQCFESHMRPGARFSCYLEDPTSKYLDDRFLEEIINHPFIDFQEDTIPVAPPPHCKYYQFQEALVIVITKR